MKILASITTALGGVIHVVEAPFSEAGKIGDLFKTVEKDEPELKTAVLQLVSQAEGIGADGATDVSAGGLNIPSDVKTFQDVVAFYAWIKTTFVPLVKSVYGEVEADLGKEAAAKPATEAETGPGLHTIVAA